MACLVFLGIAFSFMKVISSSDTSTKRGEAQGGHFQKLSFRSNHSVEVIIKEIKNASECIVELYKNAVIFKNTKEVPLALLECS